MKRYKNVFAYLKYAYPEEYNLIAGNTKDAYGDWVSLSTLNVEYELIYGEYTATEDYVEYYKLVLDNGIEISIYEQELEAWIDEIKANA